MEPPPEGRFAPCAVRDQRRKALAHFCNGIFHLHWYKYVYADLHERPHTVLLVVPWAPSGAEQLLAVFPVGMGHFYSETNWLAQGEVDCIARNAKAIHVAPAAAASRGTERATSGQRPELPCIKKEPGSSLQISLSLASFFLTSAGSACGESPAEDLPRTRPCKTACSIKVS